MRNTFDYFDEETYLAHYGILGMKWGKQNGPPYPLKESQKSTREKNAVDKTGSSKVSLKKIAKYAAIGAAVGLVAYGGYKISKINSNRNLVDRGKTIAAEFGRNKIIDIPSVGKAFSQIDTEMVSNVNREHSGTPGGQINCFNTSAAYILNSVLGIKCTAQSLFPVDPISGLHKLNGKVVEGRSPDVFKGIFNGLKEIICDDSELFSDSIGKIASNSTGILMISNGTSSHFLNYECDSMNRLSFIDCQSNKITDASLLDMKRFDSIYRIKRIIDCSNVNLKEDAYETLKYVVDFL